MSHSSRSVPLDLDTAFKAFGAVAILIAVSLTVGVLVLTDPFGEYVTTTPAAIGTVLFTGLLAAVAYAASTLGRR